MIILNAVFLIRSWQDKQIRKELQTWADENDISLHYDYPENIKKLPNFLKGIVCRITKKEVTTLSFDPTNINYKAKLDKGLSLLEVYEEPIIDLSPVVNLKHLESLSMSGAKIKNFSALSKISGLKNVTLGGLYIKDIKPLERHKNLKEMFILGTNLKDISALKNLQNLEVLILKNTSVTDLSSLKDLKSLKSLSLHYNPISDFSPLKNLSNLEFLNLTIKEVSAEQVEELKKALANCKIEYEKISNLVDP